MPKLHFSITISAPKEKVWETMLGEATYRQWTEAFAPGSHFVGSWEQGADIKFLAPDDKGAMEGMVSRIRENRPYEYISIEHLGVAQGGKDDTSSEAIKGWAGAFENYTFKETDGRTEVLVEMDTADEHQEMFQNMWPNALKKLKELAEK